MSEQLINEITLVKAKLRTAIEALEKIENPNLMDHKERDDKTRLYCLQNVAHTALEKIKAQK